MFQLFDELIIVQDACTGLSIPSGTGPLGLVFYVDFINVVSL